MSNVRSTITAYGRTPKDLLRNPAITAVAKVIYAMLDEVSGHEDVSIKRLAGWLGITEDVTRKHLHVLRDAGWVSIEERYLEGRQLPNGYVVMATNQGGGVVESTTGGPQESTTPKTRRTTETSSPTVKKATPKETHLPDDWTPTPEHSKRAADLGVDLEREAIKFRAHAEDHGRVSKSWNGAFTTWLMKADEYRTRDSVARQSQPETTEPFVWADKDLYAEWLENKDGNIVMMFDEFKFRRGRGEI